MELFVFYIGCCIGSFCYLVSNRYINKESFLFSRSYCDVCHEQLYLIDLLPIFSFAFLKGRCRFCNSKISKVHIMNEILFGCLFYALMYSSSCFVTFILRSVLCSILYIIALIDVKTMEIYDGFLYLLSIIVLVYVRWMRYSLFDCMIGMISISLPLLLLNITFKQVVGEGDIILLAIMGFCLKVYGLFLSFYIATFLGTIVSLIYIFKKKITRNDRIPFCPFLCMGFFFSFMFVV